MPILPDEPLSITWCRDVELPFDKFLSLGERSEEISLVCVVGKSGSGLPTRTSDCAVRSDHSFTTALYSDKGIFHSDLNAARNENMSE
jgi:hypothetical protein